MAQVFIVKDKTDTNFRRPFVSIHKSETAAQNEVKKIQYRLNEQAKKLVDYEAVSVEDLDINKSQIFVIYDKTDQKTRLSFVRMCSDMQNAEKTVQQLKGRLAPHAKKLVFTNMHDIS